MERQHHCNRLCTPVSICAKLNNLDACMVVLIHVAERGVTGVVPLCATTATELSLGLQCSAMFAMLCIWIWCKLPPPSCLLANRHCMFISSGRVCNPDSGRNRYSAVCKGLR